MSLIGDGLSRLTAQIPMLDAQRAGAEMYSAPKLNVFSLFRPNENTLSRVLADLLNPRGTHGQGTLFLQTVLNELGLPATGVHEKIAVRREVLTSTGRRIDLVIDTPRLLIGIENKPWAEQQDRQLIDYHEQLAAWAGRRQSVLVFLSNKKPKTGANDVLVLPYLADADEPSLRRALSRATKGIRAVRAGMHIDELIRFIDLEFEDEGVTDELDRPYIEAVRGELTGELANRKAIAMVMLAHQDVHASIIDELGRFLCSELETAHGKFKQVNPEGLAVSLSWQYHFWGVRKKSWPAHCAIGFESDSGDHGAVFFGARAPDPKARAIESSDEAACAERAMIEQAMRRVSGGRRSAWWPWWQSAEPAFWGNEFAARLVLGSPTGKVCDSPDAQDLARRFIALADAIDAEIADAEW